MAAAYDNYDYPSYWEERGYEHKSETMAIEHFLRQITEVKNVIEIGAGFGRLAKEYSFRAKDVTLTDPSAKLLKAARETFKEDKKIKFIQSSLETLLPKLKRKRFDLAVMVRVLHHIKDVDDCFKTIDKLLNPKGYLILEFANKVHAKAVVGKFFRGDFTYLLNIFTTDRRSKKSIKAGTVPFFNFHPGIIKKKLEDSGFEILETLSVSNVRNELLKKHLPITFLLSMEKLLQKILGSLNFGPSVFVLARKK